MYGGLSFAHHMRLSTSTTINSSLKLHPNVNYRSGTEHCRYSSFGELYLRRTGRLQPEHRRNIYGSSLHKSTFISDTPEAISLRHNRFILYTDRIRANERGSKRKSIRL